METPVNPSKGDWRLSILKTLDKAADLLLSIPHPHAVVLLIALAITLRLGLALSHAPLLGIDGGAYMLSALSVQGENATHVGFPRPPLAPGWLLVPFLHFMGMDIGYKLWTVLFSIPIIAPVYLLSRELAGKSGALFALAFFSVDMMQMEMMVTGSLPLIGFALIGMAVWFMIRLATADGEGGPSWYILGLGGCIGALPWINQTAAAIGVIVIGVTYVALWLFISKGIDWQKAGPYQANLVAKVLPGFIIGAVLALGALPWYWANLPGNSELRFPGPVITLVRLNDPALWIVAPIAFVVAALIWGDEPDWRVKTFAVLLAVLGTMSLFLSYDEAIINILYRSRYALSLFVYPAIAYLLCRTWPLGSFVANRGIYAIMWGVWLGLLVGQIWIFDLQTGYKDMVYPETAAVLEIPKRDAPDKAIITNAYSLSHWVAALNQVESPNTWSLEPSPYYTETDHHVRCLLGWIPDCNPRASAEILNAGYILIDDRMPYDYEVGNVHGALSVDTWGNLPDVPWLRLRAYSGRVKLWQLAF